MMLLLSSLMVGALHALAPDHWLPFVALSRAKRWSTRKTALVTVAAGLVHVLSSLIIGFAGIFLGRSLTEITHVEELRGEWFSFLLIGFGLTYLLWAIKQSNQRKIERSYTGENAVFHWIYFAIFVLGPCEPLIPFLFLNAADDGGQIASVIFSFAAATVGTMTVLSCVLAGKLEKLKTPKLFALNPKASAGALIALTGVFVRILGV